MKERVLRTLYFFLLQNGMGLKALPGDLIDNIIINTLIATYIMLAAFFFTHLFFT